MMGKTLSYETVAVDVIVRRLSKEAQPPIHHHRHFELASAGFEDGQLIALDLDLETTCEELVSRMPPRELSPRVRFDGEPAQEVPSFSFDSCADKAKFYEQVTGWLRFVEERPRTASEIALARRIRELEYAIECAIASCDKDGAHVSADILERTRR